MHAVSNMVRVEIVNRFREPSYTLRDCPIYEVNNVVAVDITQNNIVRSNAYGWSLTCKDDDLCLNPGHIYFYHDTHFSDSFGHWVFEAAVALHLWKSLKEKYPTLKLYTKLKRGYKDSMYAAFDIDPSDICYSINGEEPNRFVFTNYMTFFDDTLAKDYKIHIDRFYSHLIQTPIPKKDIDLLYLPRGRKENYVNNDRIVDCDDAILTLVNKYKHSYIYYTDTTKNIIDQVNLVRRAKVIICDYGSNFSFNTFFAEGAKILVLGVDDAHNHFAIWRELYSQVLERGNILEYIPRTYQEYVNEVLHISFSVDAIQKFVDKFIIQ